jgi:hypothetical protein
MKIAFYKNHLDWSDKLIAYWTRHKYTHVELIYEGMWYSSSFFDGGVRSKMIHPNKENWDIYTFNQSFNHTNSIEFILTQIGKSYDLKGLIFAELLSLKHHEHSEWYCSELVHASLVIGEYKNVLPTNLISPGKLFEHLKPDLKLI